MLNEYNQIESLLTKILMLIKKHKKIKMNN